MKAPVCSAAGSPAGGAEPITGPAHQGRPAASPAPEAAPPPRLLRCLSASAARGGTTVLRPLAFGGGCDRHGVLCGVTFRGRKGYW